MSPIDIWNVKYGARQILIWMHKQHVTVWEQLEQLLDELAASVPISKRGGWRFVLPSLAALEKLRTAPSR